MFDSLTANRLFRTLQDIESYNDRMVNLTANQNILSPLAMRFYRSPMGLRYDFGRGIGGVMTANNFGDFSAITYPRLHDILDRAKAKAKKMLAAEDVNLECLSGAHAMLCALLGSTRPGDTVMSVREEDGGHFCTKHIAESIGRKHVYAAYDISRLTLDVAKTVYLARRKKARIVYLDTSVLLQPHPLRQLRNGLPHDVLLIYDASHTLGLIMGGEFQSPLREGADVIVANTHKTFPGPHKGILAFRDKSLATEMDSIVRNTYSTVHTNSLMALAITVLEMDMYGRGYARQIVRNSQALGSALAKNGLHVRSINGVYSHNHQVHLLVDAEGSSIVRRFAQNGLSISTSNALGGRTFIRLGTQEATKRGMKEADMNLLGVLIQRILDGKDVSKDAAQLAKKYSTARFCFPYAPTSDHAPEA